MSRHFSSVQNMLANRAPVQQRGALVAGVATMLIWASSFVLVKLILPHIGPLTISAVRYSVGALVLLPFLGVKRLRHVRQISRSMWLRLLLMGVLAYSVANTAVFFALQFLGATTVSLLNNFIPVLVLLMSVLWLGEIPTALQGLGILVGLAGSVAFFTPGTISLSLAGLVPLLIGQISFAGFMIFGRDLARDQQLDPLMMTVLPLLLGGGLALVIALPVEGIPIAPLSAWGLVAVLSIVHTALGYVLYNIALRFMTAFEMNMILSLGPFGTALIAWPLLGERLTIGQVAAMGVVVVGVSLVQWGRYHAASTD